MISRFTDPIVSVLYPQFCGSCGSTVERVADGAACRACWESTRLFGNADPLCQKCGLPLDSASNETLSNCSGCADHHYDRAFAAGVYEKAMLASVLQLKREPCISQTASSYLIQAFERIEITPLIIPVPLSRRRRLERGFNQAAVLAKAVARRSGLRMDEYSLARSSDTPMHRAAMDSKAREATVAKAFEVVRPGLVRGQHILLVDDLLTSGATVSQCARVLKKSGADKVIVLTLARAV